MLRVIAVEKPEPIVKFVVTAHAPRKRFVRVAAIVAVVAVEVGKTMAKVPERHKKTDVVPVQNAEGNEGADKERQLKHAPERFAFILAHQRLENRDGIFPEKAEECVGERMLRFAVVAVFVN